MGRLFLAESRARFQVLFDRHLDATAQRFAAGMRRALPDLPIEEFYWRMQFMVGAMAYALSASHRPPVLADPAKPPCLADALERMIPFVAAGLKAPYEGKQ
jgi:hypothetical protein